jgi:AbrB family looped-hinge helix DNA binding protein
LAGRHGLPVARQPASGLSQQLHVRLRFTERGCLATAKSAWRFASRIIRHDLSAGRVNAVDQAIHLKYHFGMKTTIDAAGRIVVPKALRDRLALAPGSEIELEAVADGVFLRPAATVPALALEDGVLIHRGSGGAAIDVVEFLRQQRAARDQARDDR